jgi:hypothetical protein
LSTDVIASEVEAFEEPRHLVECTLGFRGERRASVQKQRAAAMGSEIAERYGLAGSRDIVQSRMLPAQMKARHRQAATVVENQLFQRTAAVAYHERRSFLGHRNDSAVCLPGLTAVKHPELDAGNVLLGDGVDDRAAQPGTKFVGRPRDDDA